MAPWDKKERKWPQIASGSGVLPRVCSVGISIWDPIFAERFHASCEHEFIHIIDGESVVHSGSKKRRAVSGDTILLRKGAVHRDEFLRESSFRVFHVMFKWKGYDAVIPKDAPEDAKKGWHGTSEYFMIRDFIDAVKNNTRPPIDIIRAIDFTVPGIIAHESALAGGKLMDVPIYWK